MKAPARGFSTSRQFGPVFLALAVPSVFAV
jgi:hypothetical protein